MMASHEMGMSPVWLNGKEIVAEFPPASINSIEELRTLDNIETLLGGIEFKKV